MTVFVLDMMYFMKKDQGMYEGKKKNNLISINLKE